MSLRPEIFVSAGSELTAARTAARQALSDLGAVPVEQLDYSIEYGPLQGVLNQMIGRCEAVIHLVGPRYGLEPSERTLGAARRSFGHYEVDVANSLGKKLYFFIAAPDYPFDRLPPESPSARELQESFRSAVENSGAEIQTFSSPEDLARKIRALRQRLIVRRRLAMLPRSSLGNKFIGRRQLLGTLAEELHPGRVVVLHPADVAAAYGGTGASTVAIELGWKLYEEGTRDFIFFLPAGPRVDVEVSLAALARNDALGLLPDEVAAHGTRLDAVLKWFEAGENAARWVVIIDGIDHIPTRLQIRTLLPNFSKGAVVLTSRLTIWPGVYAHALSPLAAEPARELLAEQLHDGHASLSYADRNAMDQLAETLGRLPLALSLAVGYLRETDTSVADFLPNWQPDPRQLDRPWRRLTLASLIDHSVSELPEAARTLLQMLTCLAPEPAAIPLALFDYRGDWQEIRTLLGMLARRELIHLDDASGFATMHRAVREIIRDRLPPSEVTAALGAARSAVDAVLRRGMSGVAGNLLRERLVPHCRALLGQLNGHPLDEHASFLAQSLAHWLKNCGRPAESEPFYRRALAIDEKHRPDDRANLILRLRDLAAVLRGSLRTAEAEPLYRRALELSEAQHGADRPDVVPDLQNLALCLRARNSLGEAEMLSQRALEIEERFSGRYHPRTAIALNRLAGIFELQKRFGEAEEMYRRALEIDESVAGPNHPRVVVLLHNLAGVLMESRRFVDAEELYRRALAIDREKFGQNHPETIPALKSLAFALNGQGRSADAESLLRRALAADETNFGPTHMEVAVDLVNLAGLLHADGRLAEAAGFLRRAIEIFAAARFRFRGEHPYLKPTVELYAEVLRAKGATEESVQAELDRIVPKVVARPGRTTLPELTEPVQEEVLEV